MPPRERKWRRRRIVLVSGLVLALFVSAAAAYVVTRKPGDVSNPDVEFRAEPSATPEQEVEPDAPGKKKTDPFDRFIWPIYGYTRDRRRYLPLKDPPHPPFDEVWRFSGNVLLEFPPVIGGKRLYLLNDHGKLFCIDKAHGQGALAPEARRARRRVARVRRRQGLRGAAPARGDGRRRQGRPGRGARRQVRQGRVEQQAREPQRVLPARRRRPALLRRRERHGLRDGHADGAHRLAVPGRRRRQGRRRARRRQALLRRLRRAHLRDPPVRRPQGVGRRRAPRARSGSGPATSTPRPPSPTAASTSATRTAASTPTARRAASSPGATAPAATSTPHRPSRRSPAAARSSTRARTTAASTRSTRARAGRSGRAAATARSPAGRP